MVDKSAIHRKTIHPLQVVALSLWIVLNIIMAFRISSNSWFTQPILRDRSHKQEFTLATEPLNVVIDLRDVKGGSYE